MSPSHTRKKGRLYRYYISAGVSEKASENAIERVPAATIEGVVIDQIRTLVQTPEIIVATWKAARKTNPAITESDVRAALATFDDLWNELFPAEQARITNLLVERINVQADALEISFLTAGLTSLITELGLPTEKAA